VEDQNELFEGLLTEGSSFSHRLANAFCQRVAPSLHAVLATARTVLIQNENDRFTK
jgi:hypothetical protein